MEYHVIQTYRDEGPITLGFYPEIYDLCKKYHTETDQIDYELSPPGPNNSGEQYLNLSKGSTFN